MTDRAQATRFCSCSAAPAHIPEPHAIADSGPDGPDATERRETPPAVVCESGRVRFCTCSDVPTRDVVGSSDASNEPQAVDGVERSPITTGMASQSEVDGDVPASLADLPQLESLADLLPGESSLFSAFTHGEEGSEVLMTDRRILLRGAPDANVLFSTVRLTDVDSVSISRARPNRRSLIWGLIGLGATVGMWQALDGVGNLRLIIAAIVLLMSAVLLADYALRPPDIQVLIRAKSGAVMSIEFAQNRADVADRFSAKVVAALEALRAF